jgi:5-methyltetrahydrofolate--homocysteine methyltransferase
MATTLLDLARERVVLLDGGMGTELIKQGFKPGACPESWNRVQADVVKGIYQAYFEAGADAVSTNSFGGSTLKLSGYGQEDRCYDFNRAAAELACSVRPQGKFVLGSMGPTGKFLQPQGDYTPEQFEDAFFEQARGLADGGVDTFLLETHYDLEEALCAIRAVRRNSDLPLGVTMTFNKTPRGFFTIMGNTAAQFAAAMEKNHVTAVGANCTLDSQEMVALTKELRSVSALPVIIQANAGQPLIAEDGTVRYSQPLDDYIKYIPDIIRSGARIIGGCCGTDPDYIRAIAEIIRAGQN